MRVTAALLLAGVCAMDAGSTPVIAEAAPAPITRTVFVSVVDKQGEPVPGLSAADFTLKEGGKDREIVSVALPTARMHLALMVEESVTADTSVRRGLFDFAKRMLPQADISIITVGLMNTTAVPYTADINAIVAGINGFSLRQSPSGEHLTEGIFEQAKVFQKNPFERPVMVVVGLETMQASAERPDRVLNELRLSKAPLYAVTLGVGYQVANVGDMGDLAERAQVLGEGTRQSGGRRIEATGTPAVPRVLQQVANELLAQYQITYVLPDGVRPSDRLSVSTKKKDVTLRAPSRISDK